MKWSWRLGYDAIRLGTFGMCGGAGVGVFAGLYGMVAGAVIFGVVGLIAGGTRDTGPAPGVEAQ
ncbi:MAG: hypothetical protein JRM77_03410 [Nitrososphaerota archaeon]|nr:hypothetical protein [Nitrososphaerota archaeon]